LPKEIKLVHVSQPDAYYYKKLLGEGAFGRVRLCIEPSTNESSALTQLQLSNELKTLNYNSDLSSPLNLKTEPDE